MVFQKVDSGKVIIKEVSISDDNKKYIVIRRIYDLQGKLLEEKEILNTNSRKMIDKAIEQILKDGYKEL